MCVAGRSREDQRMEPARFDEIRAGCWDRGCADQGHGHQRRLGLGELPLGRDRLRRARSSREFQDQALGHACVRAWNDWLFEEWYSKHPERIMPLGMTHLHRSREGRRGDPSQRQARLQGRDDARATAQRGLPPVFDTAHWDPIVRACAETGTVLSNLHVGSAGFAKMPPGAPMLELGATMFGPMAFTELRPVAVERLSRRATRN
jgi:hypothetical protein